MLLYIIYHVSSVGGFIASYFKVTNQTRVTLPGPRTTAAPVIATPEIQT